MLLIVGTATGRFDEARRIYGRLSECARNVVVYSGWARLRDLRGSSLQSANSARCSLRWTKSIEASSATPALAQFQCSLVGYHKRPAAYWPRRISPHLSWLKNPLKHDRCVQDLPFTAALHLLTAKGSSGSWGFTGAAQRLVAASSAEFCGFASFNRSITRVSPACSVTIRRLRQQLQNRAREWLQIMESHGPNRAVTPTGNGKFPMVPRLTQQLEIARFSDSVAGLVDLAFNPRLFVAELLELVASVGCVGARIVVSPQ